MSPYSSPGHQAGPSGHHSLQRLSAARGLYPDRPVHPSTRSPQSDIVSREETNLAENAMNGSREAHTQVELYYRMKCERLQMESDKYRTKCELLEGEIEGLKVEASKPNGIPRKQSLHVPPTASHTHGTFQTGNGDHEMPNGREKTSPSRLDRGRAGLGIHYRDEAIASLNRCKSPDYQDPETTIFSTKRVIKKNIGEPSVSAQEARDHFDSVRFKGSAVGPSRLNGVQSSGETSSHSQDRPAITFPAATQTTDEIECPADLSLPRDPYTADAGHTPIARASPPLVDGTNDDPVIHPQQLIPDFTAINAQSRSMFPSEQNDSDPERPDDSATDPDPPLTGQLGLINVPERDDIFLSEVNRKLASAVEEMSTIPEVDPGNAVGAGASNGGDHVGNGDPHSDSSGIRFKPSTNFGKALGEA